ncbi:hypothetical protein K402DRAFT_388240 [Aulographum hederae CBS 113979]|uniref:Inner centromere protein ARK-binding domain-containing protein n=1 Tax=Aulographum hederae CBS 113979 TaxID=1176131 RepID=A0A6G1HHG0_9PEZI|nr:hypothetical protein K402DRAFT_388240 [Aulographum hederae CBS 113979]
MATVRAKVPVGSAEWFFDERTQANALVDEEVEEFGYSVRNETDWLNEHMAEIFNSNQLNVTDIFKTPGKLRGKTPRTARKKNALEVRAPLTDIFAPNPQAGPSPAQRTPFYKQVVQFQVAKDADQENRSPSREMFSGMGKNTDSGYHGMTEDEMEIEPPVERASVPIANEATPNDVEPRVPTEPAAPVQRGPSNDRRSPSDSFVSANEEIDDKNHQANNADKEVDAATVPDDEADALKTSAPVEAATAVDAEHTAEDADLPDEDVNDHMDVDGIQSPSEVSSPVKPLLRKSSLTFSSLPAREPLAKRSMGARTSRTSQLDQAKFSGVGQSSQLGRFTGGKSLGGSQSAIQPDEDVDMDEDDVFRPTLSRLESDTTKIHNKTSTQRLHDRINMLGQSKEPRSPKPLPSNSQASQPAYPVLPNFTKSVSADDDIGPKPPPKDLPREKAAIPVDLEDEEDDWIAPIKPTGALTRPQLMKNHSADAMEDVRSKTGNSGVSSAFHAPQQPSPERGSSPVRPGFGHVKSISASVITSPTKAGMAPEQLHQKAISVSNPDFVATIGSTTPAGSPSNKRYLEHPLSASKAKLYSVFKSAKGIFASSAGVSAEARMEALSHAGPARHPDEMFSPNPDVHPTPAMYPNLDSSFAPNSPGKAQDGRRTRSSSEREQKKKMREAEQNERTHDQLEKARQVEREKAAMKSLNKVRPVATASPSPRKEVEKPMASDGEAAEEDSMPPPPPPKSMLPTANSREPRETRKLLVKPSKETLAKNKPASVPIKLRSQMMGHAQPSNAALAASLSESLPPPALAKAIQNKASNQSLHSVPSSSSMKSHASSQNARPKALEAAIKKKAEDEKAAQRKAEQKREMEQKRAAKQEEARKVEQQKKEAEQQKRAAEQQRIQEAKKAAQRQAQAQEARRLEQQRKEASRPGSRQANDLAHASHQERAQGGLGQPRVDMINTKIISRVNQELTRAPPPINPVKPPKRMFQPDDDELSQSRPAIQRTGPSFQQLDGKRRKTNEEPEESEQPRRSVMAPPIRQSNIRKETNKFTHGFMAAPAGPSHASSSMFKSTVTSQHLQQQGKVGHPNDLAKMAHGRIPFNDAPNPPAVPSVQHGQHKTPGRQAPAHAAKSSPHYQPGETIALPEIATDSEDEDSDNEFAAPDWVNSPALREQLSQQQLVDPQDIFGPIPPLQMEEIFKNKERQKKFRDRTSSANWNGADRLTEEERKRDREGRERMMKEGGWTFQNGS